MHLQRSILGALSLGVGFTTVASFETEPFTPPVFNVTKTGLPLASGLIFLTPLNTTSGSAVIMTDSGDLVWSTAAQGSYTNLLTTSLYDKPVLTFWNGTGNANPLLSGHGYGKVQILDDTYTELYSICPDLNLNFVPGAVRYDCQADIHESFVTNKGTLVVSAYNYTQADLTSVGGPEDGWIFDGLFFEIDIKTQEILFSWSALENVPINATKLPLAGAGNATDPFDYFHINSIQPVGDGYLVNSRHTWTVYLVDAKGEIEWEFEGSNGGDFQLPAGGEFSWQHRTRVQHVTSEGLILHMFDNANANTVTLNQTLGLDFHLNLTSKEATLLKRLADPNDLLYVTSQGAYDALPNENVFMGYGELPVFKEFGPEGDVRMSTHWKLDASSSYRTYRLNWRAEPAASPIVVAKAGSAFMSWNGATHISGWQIYEGETANTLNLTHTIANIGFETEVSISNSTKFVQVGALGKHRPGTARKSSIVPVA